MTLKRYTDPAKHTTQGCAFGMALFNGAMGTDLELTGPENPTWPHFGR